MTLNLLSKFKFILFLDGNYSKIPEQNFLRNKARSILGAEWAFKKVSLFLSLQHNYYM
jgi:hypothetical protein